MPTKSPELIKFEEKRLKQQKAYRKVYIRLFTGIIVGLILFLIPFAFDIYTKNQQSPYLKEYEQNQPTPSTELRAARKFNRNIIQFQQKKISTKPSYEPSVENPKKPLGYVKIPAINLDNLVVYFGDSDWVLNHGTGVLDWTSVPTGDKNTQSVITGHSGLANRIYFDNIRYLKKGDIIYLNSFGEMKSYKVTGSKVIDPKDKSTFSTMYVKKNKDEITLLTCTPIFINSHRLLVFAKRVPLKEAAKKKTARRDLFSLDHIWMFIVALLVLSLIIWFTYQRHVYNKKVHEIEMQLRNMSGK